MAVEIKIEEMPDALHELIMVVATADADKANAVEALAIADKVLADTPGSIKQWPVESMPTEDTVVGYLVPCGRRQRDAGLQAANKTHSAICDAGFLCAPVRRIVVIDEPAPQGTNKPRKI